MDLGIVDAIYILYVYYVSTFYQIYIIECYQDVRSYDSTGGKSQVVPPRPLETAWPVPCPRSGIGRTTVLLRLHGVLVSDEERLLGGSSHLYGCFRK